MKKMTLLALVFVACSETEKPELRFEKMAISFCSCLQPMIEANADAEKMMVDPNLTTADTASVAAVFRKIEVAERSARSCSESLKNRFKPLKKADWPAASPIFRAKCPLALSQETLVWQMLGESEN